jgi:hypothetical protein
MIFPSTMLPPSLIDTYRSYKQDTNTIATWLATTAKGFGYPADLLQGDVEPTKPKGRLKGKARKEAKEAAKSNSSNASPLLPRYTIGVNDFLTLAQYLAPKRDLKISANFWAAVNRAIHLRKMHTDYHALEKANAFETKSTERHFYFLGILENVRDVLKPRLPADLAQTKEEVPLVATENEDNRARFENMFAALTVEELPEEFPEASDVKRGVRNEEPTDNIYEVEPFDDLFELYLGVAALLQDLSTIRGTVKQIWNSYSQQGTRLSSAAVATNVGIQLAQQLERQFLKDYPTQKDTVNARNMFFGMQCILQGQDPEMRVRPSDPINLSPYSLIEVSLLHTHILLASFRDVLDNTDLPLYKPGFYGKFDETKDRAKMSGPQKFDEDKIILLETTSDIVFFDYINRKSGFTGADEFSKAVGIFRENRQHTLTLDFASQIHLDIRQVLRSKPEMAWSNLQTYAFSSKASLEQNMSFHKNLKIKTWPKQNDFCLQAIMHKTTTWVERDNFQDIKQKTVRNTK